MAGRALDWIGDVLAFADASGYEVHERLIISVANIAKSLPKHVKQPQEYLKPPELRRLLLALRSYGGRQETASAIRLLLLTAARVKELTGCRWSELDLDAAVWTMPSNEDGRSKARRVRILPLSAAAVQEFRTLQALNTGRDRAHVFPSSRDPRAPMGVSTVNAALRDGGFKASAHDLRRTFSTLSQTLGIDQNIIDLCQTHVAGSTIRLTYQHHQYPEEVLEAFERWSEYLDRLEKGGEVVSLKKKPAAIV
jgi:integrase